MGRGTAIGWTDHSQNFWRGCTKLSPGCAHCYMYRDQLRYGRDPQVVVRAADATFYAPLRWTDPAMVFTCSWSDFWLEEADAWREEAWDVIRRTPHLTWQILTKRPELIPDRLPADWGDGWPHVWLGVSVEYQRYLARVEALAGIPAAVRFVSAEPLLGPVDLTRHLGLLAPSRRGGPGVSSPGRRAIDWVIVGGESGKLNGGPGEVARPMEPAWALDVVRVGRAADVPVFMKQTGSVLARRWGLRHPHGADAAEWPGEYRVQEFPAGRMVG